MYAALRLLLVVLMLALTGVAIAAGEDREGVIGSEDGRAPIDQIQEELGLADAEVYRLRTTTGFVICRGGEELPICRPDANGKYVIDPSRKAPQKVSSGSASLVGSNMQIVTALHNFLDPCGRVVAPISACYFAPQSVNDYDSWVRYPLRLDDARLGKSVDLEAGGTVESFKAWAGTVDDFAVVPLQSPVLGAIPFPVVSPLGGKFVHTGEDIIAISALQRGLKFGVFVPIGAPCKFRGFEFERAGTEGLFETDCDQASGASGGGNFSRIEDRLVLRAIAVSIDTVLADDENRYADGGSYSIAIGPRISDALISVRDRLPDTEGLYFGEIADNSGILRQEGIPKGDRASPYAVKVSK